MENFFQMNFTREQVNGISNLGLAHIGDGVYDPELGDPENGIAPGTAWEDVSEDWLCPICQLGKEVFEVE